MSIEEEEYVIFQQRNVSGGAINSVTGGAVTFDFEDDKISVEFEQDRVSGEYYQFRMIITDEKNKRAGFSNKVEGIVD